MPVLGGGVKPGRRNPIWDHLTRLGAPFSLDPKNRFFFLREKMGFDRVYFFKKRMLIGICFINMTFPPMGGRCPAGADEGALDRTEREIHFTGHPHPSDLRPATFPQGKASFTGVS